MEIVSTTILFIVSGVNLLLALFIYLRNKVNQINRYFALTVLGIALWCIGIAAFRSTAADIAQYWGQFVYFVINIVTVSFLYFSFVFPYGEKPKGKPVRLLIFLGVATLFILSLAPGLIIESIYYADSEVKLNLGAGYYAHSVITALFFLFSFANLVKKYRSSSGIYKLQIRYLFVGTLISTVIAVITNIIIFSFTSRYNWVGPTATIIMVVFVAYAITRYRLMDIRLIIARSITFGLIVLIVTSLFASISALFLGVFENLVGLQANVLSGLVIGVIIPFAYSPITKLIAKLTNSFLYKKAYSSNLLLDDVKAITSSVVDSTDLLNKIGKLIEKNFYPSILVFALLNQEKELKVRYSAGIDVSIAGRLAENKEEILYKTFEDEKKAVLIDELVSKIESRQHDPIDKDLVYALQKINISIISPLFIKDKLIGVIVVGNKKSGEIYTREEIHILEIISGQLAIAIENAQLYDELKDFNKTLQQRIRTATKELRDANSRLREMDRLKSDFISIASHQLRTPLTVIKGYISMLEEGNFGKVSKKVKEQLGKVFRANERLIELVENLLDISRIEQGRQEYNFEKKRLEDVAEEVVENLSANAKSKGLSLTFDKPKKATPYVMVDRKLHEVMMNFVDNAIKYTPEGSVTVSVEPEPEGMVTFSVSDTGVGIDAETMPHLFRKFSRAEGSFQMHTEGLGLGLFVAKMIVDAHGGRIGAESKGKNKGSRFFFSLPVKKQKTPPQPHEPIRRVLK